MCSGVCCRSALAVGRETRNNVWFHFQEALMRFRSLTTLLGLLLFAGTTAAQEWKDLQVLPRNISKADMKTIMKA